MERSIRIGRKHKPRKLQASRFSMSAAFSTGSYLRYQKRISKKSVTLIKDSVQDLDGTRKNCEVSRQCSTPHNGTAMVPRDYSEES